MISDFFEVALPRLRRNQLGAAAAAIFVFAVAFVSRMVLQDLFSYRVPFITYFFAVMVATMTSGGVWGLIVLVLCSLSAWFAFFSPDAIGGTTANAVAMFMFVTFGGLIVGTIHLMNIAFEDLAYHRARAKEWLHNSALSEARTEQLNIELRHRTKNIFAIISALVTQTARVSPSMAAMGDSIRSRLRAMGAAQDLLLKTQYSGSALRELLTECLSPLQPLNDARLRIEGPSVTLEADVATPLALVIHELATNAVKYGSWSNDTGIVSIEWKVSGGRDNELQLIWREIGGPVCGEPNREGLGTKLIKSGVPGSRTKINFTVHGLVYELTTTLHPGEDPLKQADAKHVVHATNSQNNATPTVRA